MSDEFSDRVPPITGKSPIGRLKRYSTAAAKPKTSQTISGRIVSLRRNAQHHDGKHKLDITVGGTDYTELVIRVEGGAHASLEGKRVVIYVDE